MSEPWFQKINKLETELAAARAEVERTNKRLDQYVLNFLPSTIDERDEARADLARHKRALDVARASLRAYMGGLANDALKEITRILEGKE